MNVGCDLGNRKLNGRRAKVGKPFVRSFSPLRVFGDKCVFT